MQIERLTLGTALFLTLLAPACLEVEEEIEVRPDGSVEVTVRASGDAEDLAEGDPVPTWGPWSGVDAGSVAWLSGAAAPRRFADEDKHDVQVAVRASFASVDDLPRYFAPPDALYRTAHLERDTTLSVQRKGARTVYVFERRLPSKAPAAWSPSERIEAEVPAEVRKAIDDGLPLRPHQWRQAVRVVQEAYSDSLVAMTDQALLAIYLEGDAELAVAGNERAREAVRSAVVERLDEGRIERLIAFWRAAEASGDDQTQMPLDVDLDKQARAAARSALPAALEREDLAPQVVNAVLERLEWAFSALDNAIDRGDETLRVRLRLPGVLVGGSYDSVDSSGRAVWEIKDEAWNSGEIVMRAVSVLE